MKNIIPILLLLLMSYPTHKLLATAQEPDYLIIDQDTLAIFSNPLESYFENRDRPNHLFNKTATSSWRGYVAYWKLQNDKLFLIEIHVERKKLDLSLVFKDREVSNMVYADWYSHTILHPFGQLLHYEHMGYGSIYEFEKEFTFEKGVLTNTYVYDNSKSRKSPYTEDSKLLKQYLKENINYSNITDSPNDKGMVFVQVYSVTAQGQIDSVRVVRGMDEQRNKEAIRVVKSIPNWTVIYSRGKLFDLRWIIKVIFGED